MHDIGVPAGQPQPTDDQRHDALVALAGKALPVR